MPSGQIGNLGAQSLTRCLRHALQRSLRYEPRRARQIESDILFRLRGARIARRRLRTAKTRGRTIRIPFDDALPSESTSLGAVKSDFETDSVINFEPPNQEDTPKKESILKDVETSDDFSGTGNEGQSESTASSSFGDLIQDANIVESSQSAAAVEPNIQVLPGFTIRRLPPVKPRPASEAKETDGANSTQAATKINGEATAIQTCVGTNQERNQDPTDHCICRQTRT